MPQCTEAERRLIEAMMATDTVRSERSYDTREQSDEHVRLIQALGEAEKDVLKERMPPERFEQMVRACMEHKRGYARLMAMLEEAQRSGFGPRHRYSALYDDVYQEADRRLKESSK